MEVVLYPDAERVLVAALDGLLQARSEPVAANVYVSVKKPPAELKPQPEKVVVVRSDGGADLDHVRRLERIGINIFAPDYEQANELAHLVAAVVRQTTGDAIKNVRVVMHPVRVAEATQAEQRYITVEVVLKAGNLPI